jgi:hypothetical protein
MFDPTPDSSPSEIEPFLVNPANRKFVEGKSRFPVILSLRLVLPMFIIWSITLAITLSYLYQKNLDKHIFSIGEKTTATVLRRDAGYKGSPATLTYQYQVKGANIGTYQRQQAVLRWFYNEHPEKSQVTITYLPDNPSQSSLGIEAQDVFDPMQSIILSILLMITVILTVLLPMLYIEIRMAWSGRIIPGQLLYCSRAGVRSDKNYYPVRATCSFVSPISGKELTRSRIEQRKDLSDDSFPAPGTPVFVLYLNDKNHQVL